MNCLFVAVCSLFLLADFATSSIAAEPVRVVMIGDSTMASYNKRREDRPDLTGWGQVFNENFQSNVAVLNHASSGRSSKSFLKEGRWTKALAAQPDYVFIQFGHNDSPGKGERSTDPEGEFRDNLRKYISESRDAGARPVLVTPVGVRRFVDGKIDNARLKPYVQAVLAVAKETKTPVIDLNKVSVEMYERLGDEGSADLNAKPGDFSHFSDKGARAISSLVVAELPQAVPELAKSLKVRKAN